MTLLSTPDIAHPQGLSTLIAPYAALICDIWGVVHDGIRVYPEAAACMAQVRASGRAIVLVSNSPRPSAGVVEQLNGLGLDPATYDAIITSGDATRLAIAEGRFGTRVHFVGPERDRPLIAGLDLQDADIAQADFLLVTGLDDDDTETPDDYAPLLNAALARSLPLVCANPDIVVMRGDDRLWCAGALAEAYQRLGGTAHLFGKPHPPIYALCRARLTELLGRDVAPQALLAVGDGIATDIAGANAAGMDAVLIGSGIHRDVLLGADGAPSRAAVARACAEAGAHPIAMLPDLRW